MNQLHTCNCHAGCCECLDESTWCSFHTATPTLVEEIKVLKGQIRGMSDLLSRIQYGATLTPQEYVSAYVSCTEAIMDAEKAIAIAEGSHA